jgi:DNA-binding MurR/RpiR family transcriptional regulator
MMSENVDLLSKIQEKMPTLSKGQKRIAEFLSEHYDQGVYLTAAKLGEIAGVSESTVVRFAIELGFDGYPKLQRALEELVKNKLTASQRMRVSYDRMARTDKDLLRTVLEGDAERITSTLNDIKTEDFNAAVNAILNGKKIYVVGGRSSAALSYFFSFYLNFMVDNVINVTANTVTETFENIFRIGEGDVLVAMSFPRYSQKTIKAMEYANDRGATTIAITDSRLSPLVNNASVSLVARSDMVSFVDSLVAPLSVINALLVAVSMIKKDDIEHGLDKLERLWNEYQIYSSDTKKYH